VATAISPLLYGGLSSFKAATSESGACGCGPAYAAVWMAQS
jgi:hypothetical protein